MTPRQKPSTPHLVAIDARELSPCGYTNKPRCSKFRGGDVNVPKSEVRKKIPGGHTIRSLFNPASPFAFDIAVNSFDPKRLSI